MVSSGPIATAVTWPNKRIRRLVARHAGKLVPILNFDVFMTQLAEPLNFGLLDGGVARG